MMHKRSLLSLVLAAALFLMPLLASATELALFFPPEWQGKGQQVRDIAKMLSQGETTVKPVVARSYPDIIIAFSKNEPVLVYVGSFLQALLHERGLSAPIVQGLDGKEAYTSILIAPTGAGTDPVAIVKAAGSFVAYAKGTSSGESGAKAATNGLANLGVTNHAAAVSAVTTGSAKCAFVKNWWWEGSKAAFKGLSQFEYPGVSDKRNPDNVLSANKAVSAKDASAIKSIATKHADVFGVKSFQEFNPALLEPSLALMRKGNINPKAYTWL